MDVNTAFSSGSNPREASNHDELLMQQTLNFSDTLKDLEELRKQLYSAAEYFEASYHKRPQKEVVLQTLKDYAIKALISTVDHLGSVAYKLNGVFDEKIGKIGDASALELQFFCLEKVEERVKTCQDYINQRGISQQSLAIQFPKHHKRHPCDVGTSIIESTANSDASCSVEEQPDRSNRTDSDRRNLAAEYDFKNAVVTVIKGTPSQLIRGRSTSQSLQLVTKQGSFSFSRSSANKRTEKRTPSPLGFPFLRSGSLKRSSSSNYRSGSLKKSSSTNYRSEPRQMVSSVGHSLRDKATDIELYAGKNKRLFKAFIGMHKARN